MPQAVRALRGTTTTESGFRTPNNERTTSERLGRGTVGPGDERVD
jgi:hypothetical protein